MSDDWKRGLRMLERGLYVSDEGAFHIDAKEFLALEDLLSTFTVTGPGGELVQELLRTAIAFRDAARKVRERTREYSESEAE